MILPLLTELEEDEENELKKCRIRQYMYGEYAKQANACLQFLGSNPDMPVGELRMSPIVLNNYR